MSAAPEVIASLERLGVSYEVMPCDPDLADTAAFCAAYGVPLENSANAILVASRKPEGTSVICLALAHTRLDVNGMVRRRMGVRKASFADPEHTVGATGMAIGGVTVFGLPSDIPIWVDSRVMERRWIVIGAGTRTAKIKLAPGELLAIPHLEMVTGLANPPGA